MNTANHAFVTSFTVGLYNMKAVLGLNLLVMALGGLLAPKTSTPVQLSYNNSKATSAYTFKLQIETAVPATGQLLIYFPPEYSTTLGVTTCKVTDDKGTLYSCSIATRVVTIAVGLLSNSPVDNTYIFSVVGVTNPSAQGVTGHFRLETYSGINLLDYCDMFGQVGIDAVSSSLSSPVFSCMSGCLTGQVGLYQVGFKAPAELPPFTRIYIYFPSTLGMKSPPPCVSTTHTYLTCSRNQSNVVTLDGLYYVIPANTIISVTFSNLQNPSYAGSVGSITFEVFQPLVNSLIGSQTIATGPVISSNAITGVVVCPSFGSSACPGTDPYVAISNRMVFRLNASTTNNVPAGGAIYVTFPASFGTMETGTCQITSGLNNAGSTVATQVTCTVNDASKSLAITGFAQFAAGTFALQVRTTTPSSAGTTASFTVSTYMDQARTQLIDQNNDAATVVIGSYVKTTTWNISWLQGGVVQTTLQAGQNYAPNLLFRPNVAIATPSSASIEMRFGTGFTITLATALQLQPNQYAAAVSLNPITINASNWLTITLSPFPNTIQIPINQDTTLYFQTNVANVITMPATPGLYAIEMVLNNGADVEAYLHWVDVIPATMPLTVSALNVDINTQTLYKVTFTPAQAVPLSVIPVNTATAWGLIVIQFPTQDSLLNLLWPADLGTGLASGSTIPCRAISGITVASGNTLTCTLTSASSVSTSTYSTIQVSNFNALSAGTPVIFTLANIANTQASTQATITVTTYSVVQSYQQALNMQSVLVSKMDGTTATFYDDGLPSLPVINGRSPTAVGGDGSNSVTFTPNTLNVATVMSFILWVENQLTAGSTAVLTTGLILKMPMTYPIPYAGVSCFLQYTISVTCYTYPEVGWIVFTPLPSTSSPALASDPILPHTNYQITITGLTNPFNRINPVAMSIIPVQAGQQSEYIYFNNFTPLNLGAVSSVSVSCNNLAASHVDTSCTFGFILTNNLAVGSTVVITFGKNSYVLTTTPTPTCSISGGLNALSATQPIICTFAANTVTISQFSSYIGGNAVSIRIDHILNPLNPGVTDAFNIESFSQNGLLEDGNYSIPGLVILSKSQTPSLTHNGFWAVPSNGYAQNVALTVSFTPTVSLPAQSVINIIYPLEYSPLPATLVCSLGGAFTTFKSCSNDGNTVVTMVTDTKYDTSATQAPMNITITGVKNFAPGITSGIVTVSIFCSDQLITESSSDPTDRKFTTTLQTKVLALKNYDFEPQTAGEEATYNFTIGFTTTFASTCTLQLLFPSAMPKGLNQFIGCNSMELSPHWNGEMDCYASGRSVVINGTMGWVSGKSPAQVNVTISRITNPNVGFTLSGFTAFTMCGTMIYDIGTIASTFAFAATPSAMHYDNSTITTNGAGYTSSITLRLQTGTLQPVLGDQWSLVFPPAYVMDYVAGQVVCDSSQTSNPTDQCTYYENQININGFENVTSISNVTISVQGLENPRTLGELPYIVTAWRRPSTRQVIAKTTSNLNRISPFTFKQIGKKILVNYNLPWTVNIGTRSDQMFITLQSNSPTNFQLTPSAIPGITILPNPISFVLGQSYAGFYMIVAQGTATGYYNMTWAVSGNLDPTVYAPIQRSIFRVIGTYNETVTIQEPGVVPQGGASVPLSVKLSRPPANGLNLTFIQLGSIPTKMNFSTPTLRFLPGDTTKVFHILISNDSYGSNGEFFVVKTGPDARTFQLSQTSYTFQVGRATNSTPQILEAKIVTAARNSVLLRFLTNEIVTLFYMAGYYGTRAPTFSELIEGTFHNDTPIQWLPWFNNTQDFIDQTTQYEYSVRLEGLTAGTAYVFYAQIQDALNNVGLKSVNFNFTTAKPFTPAYCLMKFLHAPLGDGFRLTISQAIASVLGIKSTLVLAYEGLGNSSASSSLSDTSDAPLSTTSSGGARVLLATSYATVYLLSDPTDSGNIEPLQLLNSLNDKRLLLKSLLQTYDDSVVISALEMTAKQPVMLLQPRFVSTTNGDLILTNFALQETGYIYMCFIADPQIPVTPTSFQIINGVDSNNSPCFAADSIPASSQVSDYRKSGFPDASDFWVFFTSTNWLTMSPEMLPDSQVASLGFTTRGTFYVAESGALVALGILLLG